MATQGQLSYWEKGKRRKLRVFMSHRWGSDEALYSSVFDELKKMGFEFEDTSLSKRTGISGPRGGAVNEQKLSREIAALIYASDVVVAPSRRGAGQSDWVAWEVELAGVCYSIPVLFVDHDNDVERRNFLVAGLRAAEAKCDVAKPNAYDIAFSISRLVNTTPYKGVLEEAPDERTLYRGPIPAALKDVMNRHPYRPSER